MANKTKTTGTQTAAQLSTQSKYATNYRYLGVYGTEKNVQSGNMAIIFQVRQLKDFKNLAEFTEATKKTIELFGNADVSEAAKSSLEKKSSIISNIVLPLPNSLSESLSHGWQTTQGIQAGAGKSISSILEGVTGIDPNVAIGQAANLTGSRAPIVDPSYFQQYSGTEPRKFSFSWELVIQTKIEAQKIFEIIQKFKQYSAPEIMASNAILKAPNYWDIKIGNKLLQTSMNIQHSVITQVDVDYAGSGLMDMYFDGTPKFLKLTIGFAEIKAITRADFAAVPVTGVK